MKRDASRNSGPAEVVCTEESYWECLGVERVVER